MGSWVLCIKIFLFCVLLSSQIYSLELNELKTVHIPKPGSVQIGTFQRFYFTQDHEFIFQRDHFINLALGKNLSLYLNIPYLNYLTRNKKTLSKMGDIKLHLNLALEWFPKYILINYYLEFNTGSGADYNQLENHPIENYGHEEWRTGFIGFQDFSYFAFHWNLFYVFRSESEPTLFGSFFNTKTLNIFKKEAWERGLGFNPVHEETFFYKNNFLNDNLDINLGFNTEKLYPFAPFLEILININFKSNFPRKAPGSGIMKNQLSLGSKFFLNQDRFVIKAAFFIPLPTLSELASWGLGFGFYFEF